MSKGESWRIWVAVDIQMKGRQFGLVKAITPARGARDTVDARGHARSLQKSMDVCEEGRERERIIICVFNHERVATRARRAERAAALTLCAFDMTHCK